MLDKSLEYISVLMVKNDTDNYPIYKLPPGYSFSNYKPGFEKQWAKLVYSVDDADTLQEAKQIFNEVFLSKPDLLNENCIFVLDEKQKVVATASLWFGDMFGYEQPQVHWVSTSHLHSRKGLSKALLTKLFDIYKKQNLTQPVFLVSQTLSYKAINLYKQFGFEPYMAEKPLNFDNDNYFESNEHAWILINKKINEYKKNQYNDFVIQKATSLDSDTMAKIFSDSSKAAFKDIVEPNQLKQLTNIRSLKIIFKEIIFDDDTKNFIIFCRNVPCAICSYSHPRNITQNNKQGEIVALYVLPEYWSKNIGSKILDFATNELKRLGFESVFLWVIESNSRARLFYEKHEFKISNESKESFLQDIKEIKYTKLL